jgi:aspartate racemase
MPIPLFLPSRQRIGIIGGLGALAGADVHARLLRRAAEAGPAAPLEVLFEQRHFDQGATGAGPDGAAVTARQLYVYDMLQRLARRGAACALVPCFISRTFLPELQAELALPVVDIVQALRAALARRGAAPCRVGVLTTDYVRRHGLFDSAFGADGHTVLYPDAATQAGCVMAAVYGSSGGSSGGNGGSGLQAGGQRHPAGLLLQACAALMAAGADVIVPGATEIAIVAGLLAEAGFPVLDSNQLYVDHALSQPAPARPRRFQIGIVGGVGPAATVDFMHKIVVNTVARCDQQHLPLLVEHNPAIPDRTAHLTGHGADPTLALYAACRRLEERGAGLIAIPCNTAHAYVDRLAPRLAIPIVHMLAETVAAIAATHGGARRVGLLATSGTLASRVYHAAAQGAPFELLVPDPDHQALVMRAVYGRRGIKAGFVDGPCRADLWQALTHLTGRGATLVILGCTELPLLLREGALDVGGTAVVLLDPTAILARRCVALALAGGGGTGPGAMR